MSEQINNPTPVDPNQPITVVLSAEKWNVVSQCMDLAVKSGGISNGITVIPVFQEMQDQISGQLSKVESAAVSESPKKNKKKS